MNADLLEISDGRFYNLNDMVKAGCHDCDGCSECCQGMGDSILLDPYDMYQLSGNLHMSFEQLLTGPVELHMEEGLILPNLAMQPFEGEAEGGRKRLVKTPQVSGEACSFLNEEGRCSIHAFRPGLCRLFPLGRNYEEGRMNYFLLTHECPAAGKSKVKVSKWLGVDRIRDYQSFLIRWHDLSKRMRAEVTADPEAVESNKRTCMMFLQFFYARPYTSGDFFREFAERAEKLESLL